MFKYFIVALSMICMIAGTSFAGDDTSFGSFYGVNSPCFMSIDYYNTEAPIWVCGAKNVVVKVATTKELRLFVIFFDFDKADIKKDQLNILNEIRAYVKKHNVTGIALSAFCDFRGSAAYNKTLGQKRINAVEEWFIDNNIEVPFVITNNGSDDAPVRKLNNNFCQECWKDRRVNIGIF